MKFLIGLTTLLWLAGVWFVFRVFGEAVFPPGFARQLPWMVVFSTIVGVAWVIFEQTALGKALLGQSRSR
jgi:hypothetical protein